jgi:arylsulfatase A-like enzyme
MPAKPSKPNILLILSDDHGYGDASAYGGPNIRTPAIDRIAAEGARFTRFYANSPVCSPSRAALLTGCHPDRVGVPGVIRTHAENSYGYFDPAATTLPQMLGRGGYHSTIIGKWHLGLEPENHPCERGFDAFRGFLGDMMDDYWTHLRHGNNYMRHGKQTVDPQGHATDLFTDWAIEVLREQGQRGTPFFLFLAYNAPHTPIQPPDEWFERVRKREPGISGKRARYVAMVEHMDAGIGRVLDALDGTGLAENTLVIYVSDNGGQVDAGACNGNLRGAKQEMFEGGIRVPCCVRWPGHVEPGLESAAPAMLMDLYPTLCRVAGVDVGHNIDGQPVPDILGDAAPDDPAGRLLYWVRRESGEWQGHKYFGNAYYAVRRGEAKLLQNGAFSPMALYRMDEDPMEETDRADLDVETRRELEYALQQQIKAAAPVPWQKPTN